MKVNESSVNVAVSKHRSSIGTRLIWRDVEVVGDASRSGCRSLHEQDGKEGYVKSES